MAGTNKLAKERHDRITSTHTFSSPVSTPSITAQSPMSPMVLGFANPVFRLYRRPPLFCSIKALVFPRKPDLEVLMKAVVLLAPVLWPQKLRTIEGVVLVRQILDMVHEGIVAFPGSATIFPPHQHPVPSASCGGKKKTASGTMRQLNPQSKPT